MSTLSPGAGPASDRCPLCGATVIADLIYSIGAGPKITEPDQQRKRCPSCGTELRRNLGESWRVVDSDDRSGLN